MSWRARGLFLLLLLSIASVVVTSCKNEPYESTPLGVLAFVNHGTMAIPGYSNAYKYRDKKIYTFKSTTAAGILVSSMRFAYVNEDLKYIVSDSVEGSWNTTTFFHTADFTVVDSTRQIKGLVSTPFSTRTVVYDANGKPVSIKVKTLASETNTEQMVELEWTNDNVTKLSVFDVSTGEKVPTTTLVISYDEQFCVFTENTDYLFTLPLTEMYWLSKNNPITFYDGSKDKKYIYWYNKMGYPSNFQNAEGAVYGITYTQLR